LGIALSSSLTLASPFIAPALGQSDSASAPMRLSQSIITVGDPAIGRVNVHAKFSAVDMVCFDFTFANDLLDPGETLLITPLEVLPPLGGPGFSNVGTTSQAQRTLCLTSTFQPDLVAPFADGKEKKLQISMQTGSAQIASILVNVIGTAR